MYVMSAQYCDAKDLNWYLGPIIAFTVSLLYTTYHRWYWSYLAIFGFDILFLRLVGLCLFLWISREFCSYFRRFFQTEFSFSILWFSWCFSNHDHFITKFSQVRCQGSLSPPILKPTRFHELFSLMYIVRYDVYLLQGRDVQRSCGTVSTFSHQTRRAHEIGKLYMTWTALLIKYISNVFASLT